MRPVLFIIYSKSRIFHVLYDGLFETLLSNPHSKPWRIKIYNALYYSSLTLLTLPLTFVNQNKKNKLVFNNKIIENWRRKDVSISQMEGWQ
jgi:hypothetical protein